MSRRNAAVKREVLPDPLYSSTLVTKIVNQVMLDGKKGIAQSIVYTAMKNAAEKLNDEAMNVLTTAIENIKPKLDLSKVGMEDSLVNDLRIDSLTMLMLSLAVEKEFAINVNAGERFVTVRDVVEYVGRNC